MLHYFRSAEFQAAHRLLPFFDNMTSCIFQGDRVNFDTAKSKFQTPAKWFADSINGDFDEIDMNVHKRCWN